MNSKKIVKVPEALMGPPLILVIQINTKMSTFHYLKNELFKKPNLHIDKNRKMAK